MRAGRPGPGGGVTFRLDAHFWIPADFLHPFGKVRKQPAGRSKNALFFP